MSSFNMEYEAFEQSAVQESAANGTNLRRQLGAAGISAAVSNRTHRVVRERANLLRARRDKVRSLWVPLAVCASLLVAVCSAVWTVLVEYEAAPSGIPDASKQLFLLMMWSLPLSAALLALVWFRRSNGVAGEDEGESTQ